VVVAVTTAVLTFLTTIAVVDAETIAVATTAAILINKQKMPTLLGVFVFTTPKKLHLEVFDKP
jgi:hypothetical protein